MNILKRAFDAIKQALTRCVCLRAPDWNSKFKVSVEVSDHALEVRLFQQPSSDNKVYPIYVASRLNKDYEAGYHRLEKQVLAMVYASRKFRHYLSHAPFVFLVECAALRNLMILPVPDGRIGK